jgi:hypothetical protein
MEFPFHLEHLQDTSRAVSYPLATPLRINSDWSKGQKVNRSKGQQGKSKIMNLQNTDPYCALWVLAVEVHTRQDIFRGKTSSVYTHA